MPARGDDWPSMGEDDAEWRTSVEKFMNLIDVFVDTVESFDRTGLHNGILGEHYPYSYFEMFFRVAFHNIHHGAQIAFLRPK